MRSLTTGNPVLAFVQHRDSRAALFLLQLAQERWQIHPD